jgi:alpha-mannosidase
LLIAERMAALAEIWVGQPPDRPAFQRLWSDLCFNQFHDILGGTCIKEAQDESEMALGRVVLSSQELANTAGRLVGAQVNTSGPGGTVILFNPFPYPLESYCEYEPWTGWERWTANYWGLVDELGAPVACQPVEAQPAVSLTAERGFDRLVFKATLPPSGYRVYRFDHGLPSAQPAQGVSALPDGLENERLSIYLDPQTGDIVSCRDKQTGLELVGAGGWNVPQVLDDPSDTWSHAVRSYDQLLGQFGSPVIKVIDQGPLQASLLVERTWEDASGAHGTWTQQIVLRSGEKELLLRNWLHWQGGWRTLKLAFDAAVASPQGVRDVAFGALPFPNDGMETPMHMWAAVTGVTPGGSAGLAVLNDGKYGCDLSGSVLRLTILRSPPYAYHVPHVIGSKQRYDWIDQGLQEFNLVVRPFTGAWQAAGVVQRARELNLPIQAVTMHAHPGNLPPSLSLCSLDSPELELTALKPAEDGAGYILRFADRHGLGGRGTLVWQGQAYSVTCNPYEVKTLRIWKSEGGWSLSEQNMLEAAPGES